MSSFFESKAKLGGPDCDVIEVVGKVCAGKAADSRLHKLRDLGVWSLEDMRTLKENHLRKEACMWRA